MTNTRFLLPILACASIIPLLGACAPSSGYYDDKGNYIYADTPYSRQDKHAYADAPATQRHDENYYARGYDRPGYYDYNGYYIDRRYSNMRVTDDMLPPRGMCRVWFAERAPADQPAVESCTNIRSRVPVGAYVIYGG